MLLRLLPVCRVLGLMLIVFGLAYLPPLASALIYADGTAVDFVYAMFISVGAGIGLWFIARRHRREMKARDGFLLVTLSWVLMAAIATVPLMLVIDDLSFTDAFFETMSGLTTTGATVLTGLDRLPPTINLWRHELNWLGGMGIIVLAVAILPLLGVGGMQLFKAETTGVNKDSKLTARIGDTAKALWLVYFAITAACILSLKFVGMNWLDAICHAFAPSSLGGFPPTTTASAILIRRHRAAIFFMPLAAMNSATIFAWRLLPRAY
jgi:trk system potassium uptake protein TrkH